MAFQRALLRSEKKRTIGIIIFLSFFAVLIFIRMLLHGLAMSHWGFVAVTILIGFEFGSLYAIVRALNSGRDVPGSLFYFCETLESLCPAVGIAFASNSHIPPAYRPLATPWVLVFFSFTLLSVLRLRPRLCWFSGLVSSIAYLGAAYHLGWRFVPISALTATQAEVLYFALFMFGTGGLAAGVATEIRMHVQGALREAEMHAQLKQVEHELDIARSIQQSLLPKFQPLISGFQVAGWSRTADDIGGDFYDWKRLSDGRWVVILADVTGHGIGPAILASVCRAYSRASFNVYDDLETTLRNINQSFAEDLTPERFATFVAAVFEETSDQVEILSAGHGPLLVYSSDSASFQFLDAQALPLGILPEMKEARPVRINMKPGDMVLLVTDGFFEWEDQAGGLFGTDRMAEVVRRYSDLEPEGIIAELYQAVLAFSQGTPQKDDLTAVLIKRQPVSVAESDKLDSFSRQVVEAYESPHVETADSLPVRGQLND
jgi:serine phosphatase RsbU (regulator of sigma subunit)